jgi:hypothetical protein
VLSHAINWSAGRKEIGPMKKLQSLAFALPILPGKTDESRRLAETLNGPRRGEKEDFLRRGGVATESWYLQSTTQGDMLILYLEGEDIGRAFQVLIASGGPFERWYKEQLLSIHGIDFNQPLPGPIAEPILEVQGR